MNFRYKLQKYSGSKTRFFCPNCKEKEFIRYIDSITKELLPIEYGRCNREIKCGYFKHPYGDKEFIIKNNTFSENIEPKQDYISKKVLNNFDNISVHNNPLFKFLVNYFKAKEVVRILELYQVKTEIYDNSFLTIFPQIDSKNRLCALKKMKYNANTGKRDKSFFRWYNPTKMNIKQCLFGLHLVDTSNEVFIIESEKSAIICSLFYSNKLFMATGGLNNLTRNKLIPLKGKKIILIPDLSPTDSINSAYSLWYEKGKKISQELNLNIYIENYFEKNSNDWQKNQQWDIADFIIEEKKDNIRSIL